MNPTARRLIKLHDIFLYITIFVSFLAVITAYSTPIWLTLGFPVAMVGAHFFYRSGRAKPSHNRWWNALILAVAALSLFDYFFNTLIDVMAIGVRFVLILTIIKLFSRQGARDEFQLYALSFLTLAGASALSEQFFFGIYFGLYVLTGTFALALLHLKTEAQKSLPLDSRRHSPFDRLYGTILATISLLIFASSLVVFFAFPRIGLGFFADPARSSIPISGFSDSIDFGSHGSVRDNPTVIMRVEFDDGPPDDYAGFRWRVMSFDQFDGMGWSRSDQDNERRLSHGLNRQYDLRRLYSEAMREHLGETAMTMEIYLEPLGRNVVPTIWPTTDLRIGAADTPRMLNHSTAFLKTDGYGDLHHSLSGDVGLAYQITVAEPPPSQAILGATGHSLSPTDEERYLQLPDDVDSRVADLAVDLTQQAEGNYEKAQVIGEYLTTSYDYTLDLPELSGTDPVAEFLFDHREGHCEYFATTAAVLLRVAGVPTRVVNGFLGGDWNDVGEYLTVRQGDAHAWIEVYVPEMGWVPYDPTPAIESSFLDRSGIGRLLSDTADALRHGWTRWFIEYDLRRQVNFFRDIADALAPASDDDGDERRQTQSEEEDDDESPVPLRGIIFWGGWLGLIGASYVRGRTFRDITHWRFALGLSVGVVTGAAWVGWFQGYQWWWTSTGALSVFAASAIPAWQRRSKIPSDLRLATTLFQSIERRATNGDLARRPGEGPGAYLQRLADERPTAAPQLQVFRKLYLEVRFGHRQLDDSRRQKLKQSARAARSAL